MLPQYIPTPAITIRPARCKINLKYPPGLEGFYCNLLMPHNPIEEEFIADTNLSEYDDYAVEEHFARDEENELNSIELIPEEDECPSLIEISPELDENYQESSVLLDQEGDYSDSFIASADEDYLDNSIASADENYLDNSIASADENYLDNSIVSADEDYLDNSIVSADEDISVFSAELSADENYLSSSDFNEEQDYAHNDLNEYEDDDNDLAEEPINLLELAPALYWQYPYQNSDDFFYWHNN